MGKVTGLRIVEAMLWTRASLAFLGAAARHFRTTTAAPRISSRTTLDFVRGTCSTHMLAESVQRQFGTVPAPGGLNAANSHLDLAHTIWQQVVKPGDVVIDATCGNGFDSLVLAHLALTDATGKLYCFDIQESAMQATRQKLLASLQPPLFDRVHFLHQSHETFPNYLDNVTTVVYNLGYLPKGDKNITTAKASTLASIQSAMKIVRVGGLISVLCYVGHPEGKLETAAIQAFATDLDKVQWRVFEHRPLNRPSSPILITMHRLA